MSLRTETVDRLVVTIREYESSSPLALDDDAVALLSSLPSDRLDLRPANAHGMFVIKASSWVGAVVLPNLTIRILPKVDDLRTVLTMFASGAGLVDWGTDHTAYQQEDLVEGIAELALRMIGSATRRGLVHGYRHAEERLSTIRGRLDVQQLASRPWDAWPVPCRYDDFTPDIPENRVFLAAIRHITRWPVSSSVRRLSSDLLQRLGEVGDSPAPLLEADRVRCSPINEHYQAALAVSRLVLEGFGLAQAHGSVTALTFLVDMNRLFEKWIGDELTARLWPSVQVLEQQPVPLSLSPRVTMAPDLVFKRDGKTVFVADVKYKLTGGGLARTDDYYQLLAYTTAMKLSHGLLIYCRAEDAPELAITVVGGGQRLHTHPLSLAGSPVTISGALDGLASTIRALIDRDAGYGVTHG